VQASYACAKNRNRDDQEAVMAFFGSKKEEESGYAPVESDVELSTPVGLTVYLPKSLVTSDIFLSTIPTDMFGANRKFTTENKFSLKSVYWFVQQKESRRDDNVSSKYPNSSSKTAYASGETYKLDKFLLKFVHSQEKGTKSTPFFLMADVFFDPNTSYTAKALGIYSSIPKVLSVNFKHHGELHAEKHSHDGETNWQQKIVIVPDDLKLEKRARPNFFWLECTNDDIF
jgi:hypothetical protein